LATVKKGKVNFSFWMSEVNPKTKTNKVASVEYFVTAAAVTAYNAAADDAARAATLIGVLGTALENLTLGTLKSVSAGFDYSDSFTVPAPDVFAFSFDKFLISSRDTVDNRAVTTTIPARNDTNISIESDGTTVDIAAPDMSDFVTAYEAVVLSDSGNAVNVIRATISS